MENLENTLKEEFIKKVNNTRKEANGWYFISHDVNGIEVSLKGIKTWLQIIQYKTVTGHATRDSGCMEISVKEFKEKLSKIYDYALKVS